ncbi:hypothetical protein OIU78_020323 [Salix suchowensis]|nr:hypothetical protein OIU78_020323 [Salix suchowensis]
MCMKFICLQPQPLAGDAINVFNDHTCTKFILQITKLLLHFPGLKFNFPIPGIFAFEISGSFFANLDGVSYPASSIANSICSLGNISNGIAGIL